ncbi:hypothetical protein PHBOTO_002527 [Pseudozyma hubeiensis]|nr:hypothetical protein PHBOTO_002527 [Pseudozyma hubeiensis]
MTKPSISAQDGTTEQPSEARERIRACSIALSSGSSKLGDLEWSELGQALVVTDEAIIVLSPLTGLHPTLAGQSRTQDVECHPDWQDRFPHSVAQINVKTFLEHETSIRRRILLESDHSSVDVRFLSVQWTSASWSKPGMGPNQGCLILATTSELDLFVLGAPLNAWTGEWKLLHAVSLDPIAASVQLSANKLGHADKEVFSRPRALLRKKQLATEVLSASWSDVHGPTASTQTLLSPGSQATYIVAGTRSGHIGVWQCAAISGHCTFMSATPVSSTGIEKLLVSPSMGEKDKDALAKIAYQDSDGVKLCDFFIADGGVNVKLSKVSPVASDRRTITAWHWRQHRLIYSTIGRVHVYDAKTGRTASYILDTNTNSNSDPYSPTICISDCFDSQRSINVNTYLHRQQQDIKMKFSATALVGTVAALLSCVQAAPLEKRAYVDGFDVSRYQPNADMSGAYASGARFVVIKATEGTSVKSSTFSSQYNAATNAGLIRGAYHFARPDASSGSAQANYFLNNGGGWSSDGRTLPGALDLESSSGVATCYGLSQSQMVSWISDFGNTYHAATGRYPMLYTGAGWWNQCVASSAFASNYALWVANYGVSSPKIPTGFNYWSFWQYGDSGKYPGDQDYWNGSLDSLKKYATG